jgi:type III secretory pathway component EscU
MQIKPFMFSVAMQSGIVLSGVIYDENKPFMLSVIILSVIMLSVIMLSVIMLSGIMLSGNMLSGIMLCGIMILCSVA